MKNNSFCIGQPCPVPNPAPGKKSAVITISSLGQINILFFGAPANRADNLKLSLLFLDKKTHIPVLILAFKSLAISRIALNIYNFENPHEVIQRFNRQSNILNLYYVDENNKIQTEIRKILKPGIVEIIQNNLNQQLNQFKSKQEVGLVIQGLFWQNPLQDMIENSLAVDLDLTQNRQPAN